MLWILPSVVIAEAITTKVWWICSYYIALEAYTLESNAEILQQLTHVPHYRAQTLFLTQSLRHSSSTNISHNERAVGMAHTSITINFFSSKRGRQDYKPKRIATSLRIVESVDLGHQLKAIAVVYLQILYRNLAVHS